MITPLTREERERTADVAAKVNEVIAVVNDLTAPVTAQNLDAPEKRQAADPTESDARQWGDALVGAGLPRWLADTIVGQIEQIRADVVVSRADRDALTAERDALRAQCARLREALRQIVTDAPPPDWEAYDDWGDPTGADISNGDDLHEHGMTEMHHRLAGIARAALGEAAG